MHNAPHAFRVSALFALGLFLFAPTASALVAGIIPQQQVGNFDAAGQGFVKELGAHSVRLGYNHGDHDFVINWAAENGKSVLLMLGYGEGCDPTTAAGRQCYADRSANLAQTYGSKVKYYEVWNEWNGGFGLNCTWNEAGTPCVDGAMYTDLLCRTHNAIKAVQPNAKIIGGATAGVDTTFIGKMLEAGAAQCMDMVSVHPYVYTTTRYSVPYNSSGTTGANKFAEAVTAVNDLVKSKTTKIIPVVASEDGRSDKNDTSNEQLTADYVTALFNKASTLSFLEGIWWYALEDYDAHAPGYGLVRSDTTKKPSFAAFKNAVASLTPPPPPAPLVAHWKLDETTGTTASDSSGNSNTGTLQGANGLPAWQPTGGKIGGALSFDGVDDRVEKTAFSGLPSGAITVSAWVKLDAHKNWNNIVNHEWTGTGGWSLFTDASGVATFGVSTPAQNIATKSGLTAGTWHHLTGVYDGSNVRIYVDDQEGTPRAISGAVLDNVGNVGIGGATDGSLDDVRIYNRALSAQEVTDLYNAGVPTTINQTTPASPTAAAGSSFNLGYNWNAVPTSAPHNAFVHIINSAGTIVIQDDHVPPTPTTQWSGAVTYTRSIAVPSTLPNGTYPIRVGLYNPTNNARLALTPGPGVTDVGNLSYGVRTLTVSAPDTTPPTTPGGSRSDGETEAPGPRTQAL